MDKFGPILAQLSQLFAMDAGVLARRPDDAVVTVFDGDGDKSLHLQIGDVGLNLAFADVEEFGKIPIGCVRACLKKRTDWFGGGAVKEKRIKCLI